ncbi:alcohol dehydrogenase catalytic domain-containing protein [Thalassobium sp. R2A62]|uniref:alcohol dehydrogenase catalytic domain-containing protein n=1 Tax=Thalassobium sp. R2A62 TaxID=633131 RepID=UPI0001B1D0FB|nr:alcohol dehydrogenase catalytic domain-containing protein [Thalassobium sp. R2A62]EET46814.1 alcohol dehydrogenase, propanol-preferring [Thalassobium sp. R2A62]MDG2453059.1 alcohol dehydrogenase catalytic domain-containing protein [Paracoccaceae bacterium]
MPIPSTMKAAVLREYHQPLALAEVSTPQPKDDEALVRIEASGLCFTDVHIWKGEHAPPILPLIMGHEGVGRVVALGPNAKRLKIGDRVGIGYLYSACGHCRDCLTGGENYCPDFDATGFSTQGCFAEYVCLRDQWANIIPDGIDPVEAAPLMCAGAAAFASIKKTELQAGDTVAIFGMGGLGQYAVQIAKLMGLRVIAVDISADKLATAKQLGADKAVVADEKAAENIIALGGAHGCVNFAPVIATWPIMLDACNPRARIVLTGVPAKEMSFYTYQVVERGLSVVGSSASNRQEMNELLALAASGNVKGVINAVPFDDINDALTSLIEGRVEGRTVLAMTARDSLWT